MHSNHSVLYLCFEYQCWRSGPFFPLIPALGSGFLLKRYCFGSRLLRPFFRFLLSALALSQKVWLLGAVLWVFYWLRLWLRLPKDFLLALAPSKKARLLAPALQHCWIYKHYTAFTNFEYNYFRYPGFGVETGISLRMVLLHTQVIQG